MKAVLIKVPTCDASRPWAFHIGIEKDGNVIHKRFLLRGPWNRSTANRHRRNLQHDIDNGTVRIKDETISE